MMDGGNVTIIIFIMIVSYIFLELRIYQKVFISIPYLLRTIFFTFLIDHKVFGSELSQLPYTEEGIASLSYLYQCIDEIIRLIDVMVERFPFWDAHLQVRAGIAAWDAGVDKIYSHELIDYYTTNNDFSADIFARAQFFFQKTAMRKFCVKSHG